MNADLVPTRPIGNAPLPKNVWMVYAKEGQAVTKPPKETLRLSRNLQAAQSRSPRHLLLLTLNFRLATLLHRVAPALNRQKS